jgi:hypothetical protein
MQVLSAKASRSLSPAARWQSVPPLSRGDATTFPTCTESKRCNGIHSLARSAQTSSQVNKRILYRAQELSQKNAPSVLSNAGARRGILQPGLEIPFLPCKNPHPPTTVGTPVSWPGSLPAAAAAAEAPIKHMPEHAGAQGAKRHPVCPALPFLSVSQRMHTACFASVQAPPTARSWAQGCIWGKLHSSRRPDLAGQRLICHCSGTQPHRPFMRL